MDVPLWAFLLSTVLGPAIGAGFTVLGVMLNNKHTAQENERNRAVQRTQAFSQWRTEQRNQTYEDVLAFAEEMKAENKAMKNQEWEEFREAIDTLIHRYGQLQARLNLHASHDVREAVEHWFWANINANETEFSHMLVKVEWKEQQDVYLEVHESFTTLHESLRKHLDELEGQKAGT